MDRENLVEEPQGPVSAFGGRLVLDPDTRIVVVDGREVQLTYQNANLLRGLIELGEGVHDPQVIIERVWRVWLHPVELNYPITALKVKLGEPYWIERSEGGFALRAPEAPGPPAGSQGPQGPQAGPSGPSGSSGRLSA